MRRDTGKGNVISFKKASKVKGKFNENDINIKHESSYGFDEENSTFKLETKFYKEQHGVPDIKQYIKDAQKNKNPKENSSYDKSVGVKYQPLYVSQIHIAPSDEKCYPIPANLIKSVEERQDQDEVDQNSRAIEEKLKSKIHQAPYYRNTKGGFQVFSPNGLKTVVSNLNDQNYEATFGKNAGSDSKESTLSAIISEPEGHKELKNNQVNKAKIFIKTPYADGQDQEPTMNKSESRYNKNKDENGKTIEITEMENVDFRNAGEDYFKIKSGDTGDNFYVVKNETKPNKKKQLPKSYIPVVHNYVVEFMEEAKEKPVQNKYNALKENKQDIEIENNK